MSSPLPGPITHLLIPALPAGPGRLWLTQGWGEERTEPVIPAVPSMAASQEDTRQRGVLSVLLSPPELPKIAIYTHICVTQRCRG